MKEKDKGERETDSAVLHKEACGIVGSLSWIPGYLSLLLDLKWLSWDLGNKLVAMGLEEKAHLLRRRWLSHNDPNLLPSIL